MKIEDKLKLIQELFNPVCCYRDTKKRIDDETDKQRTHFTRAFAIGFSGKYKKKDLQYINKTCKKLISVLGTDTTMLTEEYVKTKLHWETNPSNWDGWISLYITLLDATSAGKE